MGHKHYQCIIDVELNENARGPMEITEVKKDGYTVAYEGSWTWVYFKEKPSEEIRKILKDMGFRFSRKRMAWYLPKKVFVQF